MRAEGSDVGMESTCHLLVGWPSGSRHPSRVGKTQVRILAQSFICLTSETKKGKKRKHDYIEMEIDSEKKKQERRKSNLVTCYIRVLFYFQFLFWVPKKFHSWPTLCSWCYHVGPITHVLTCCIEPSRWVPRAQAKRTEGDRRETSHVALLLFPPALPSRRWPSINPQTKRCLLIIHPTQM